MLDWFNTRYYHILYGHRGHQEAENFIDKLTSFLEVQANEKILDVPCGRGRHAIHLHKKGLDVTGIDLAPCNIAKAKKYETKGLHFEMFDMTKVYKPNYYDYVLNLFTSFGYFESDAENIEMIDALCQSLKPKAKLVIDFFNTKYVLKNLEPHHEIVRQGIVFDIKKYVEGRYLYKTISFEDKNKPHTYQERVMAVSLESFQEYFEQSKLNLTHLFGSYSLSTFDENTSERMIFILEKKA